MGKLSSFSMIFLSTGSFFRDKLFFADEDPVRRNIEIGGVGKNGKKAVFKKVSGFFAVGRFEGKAIEKDEPFGGTDSAEVFKEGLRLGLVWDLIVNKDVCADEVVLLLGLRHKKSGIGTNVFKLRMEVIQGITPGEVYDSFINFYTGKTAATAKFFFQEFGDTAQAQAQEQDV